MKCFDNALTNHAWIVTCIAGYVGQRGFPDRGKNAIFVLITLNDMKRILLVVALLLAATLCFAQQKTARVTLKNGTVLSGWLVELDPMSHLVINVAGLETRIEMDNVISVENVETAKTVETDKTVETPKTVEPVKTVKAEESSESPKATNAIKPVTESLDVPDSFTIPLENASIEMVLVKGGGFMMGFDGYRSLRYYSEPIHPVRLNSFYVSKEPITIQQAREILNKKLFNAKVIYGHYAPISWDPAKELANKLSEKSNLPVRLISEAEWEYIATSDWADAIKTTGNESEWCYDYFADYQATQEPLLNPLGPEKGGAHVVRVWSVDKSERHMRVVPQSGYSVPTAIRIVLPAADYK